MTNNNNTTLENNYNILITTHTPKNLCTIEYVSALMMTQKYLNSKGIECNINFIVNGVSFSKSRNIAVANVLKNTKYTHLLFINNDVVWKPEYIELMINSNKNIVGGACPNGNIKWENILSTKITNKIQEFRDIVLNQNPPPTDENIQKTIGYLTNYIQSNSMIYNIELGDNLKIENYLLDTKFLTTDFMLIKRNVLEQMIDKYSHTKYYDKINCGEEDNKYLYALFQSQLDDCEYLNCEQVFCKRWKKINGKIYTDVRIPLTRSNVFRFNGNFYMALNKKEETEEVNKKEENTKEENTEELDTKENNNNLRRINDTPEEAYL